MKYTVSYHKIWRENAKFITGEFSSQMVNSLLDEIERLQEWQRKAKELLDLAKEAVEIFAPEQLTFLKQLDNFLNKKGGE